MIHLLTQSYQIFSGTDIAALIANFFTVIGDNIAVVLGLTGTMFGVYFVLKLIRKAQKGRVA